MTSFKHVPKGWGYEKWIVNNDKYCGKLLFFNKGKKKSFLIGDRRNPCKIFIKEYGELGMSIRETRGFILERDVKGQMYYVMMGNGGDEQWYPYSEIELVKGHWTNKPREVNTDGQTER